MALCLDDEVLVSLDLGDTLREFGIGEVLTASTLESARALVADRRIDVAVLDINLGQGETSFEIAEMVIAGFAWLASRGP